MNLRAANVWLFLVAAVLAIVGMVEHLSLSIPGLSSEAAVWLAFMGWFLLAIGSVLPFQAEQPE